MNHGEQPTPTEQETEQGIFDLFHIDNMKTEDVIFNKKGVFNLKLYGSDKHTISVTISKSNDDYHCSMHWHGRNRLQNQSSVDYVRLENILSFMRNTAKRWSLKGLCLSSIEIMNQHGLTMRGHVVIDNTGREICSMIGLRIKERRAMKQLIADAFNNGRKDDNHLEQAATIEPMTKKQITELQQIIDGQFYSELLIELAITQSKKMNNPEATICLNSLRNGKITDRARFTLNRFVCDLSDNQPAEKKIDENRTYYFKRFGKAE